jgi:hypothetical protein
MSSSDKIFAGKQNNMRQNNESWGGKQHYQKKKGANKEAANDHVKNSE